MNDEKLIEKSLELYGKIEDMDEDFQYCFCIAIGRLTASTEIARDFLEEFIKKEEG